MIQTQSDRPYWNMQTYHPYSYSPHFRSYPPSHHNPLHHSPVSPVHPSSIPSSMHHSSQLMHSSHVPLSHNMVSSHSIVHPSHTQNQGQSEPRTQQLTMTRELSQYVDQGLEGFPTRPQFESLLNDYILSLSPKKRDKALIPQKRYDNILAVLKDPKCTTIESAQFRFWAKKMFRLSQEDSNVSVVCHEGKPVAVREQLYAVLTESHNRAQHGGRDKTSAEVRKHYSWVPKELIARFVRHCPSCTLRRSNPLDYPTLSARSPSQDMVSTPSYKSLDSPTYNKNMDQISGSPTYSKNIDQMSPSPSYSSSSGSSSPISPIIRHQSNETLNSPVHDSVPVSTQSMPQLQAMASGSVMMPAATSADVSYQYAVASSYGNNMGEGTGNSLVAVSNMDSHGMYSRGAN